MLKRLRRYIIMTAASSVIAGVVAAPLSQAAALQAYLAIGSFAPWNMLISYVEIITIPSDAANEFPALRPFEPFPEAAHVGKELANNYSLTRGSAFYLRPITAVIDLLLHILSDAGLIGCIVAIVQLAIGAGLAVILYRRSVSNTPADAPGFYFYTIFLPLGAVALASVAAIPVWLLAYLGLAAFHVVVGFAVQGGATGGVLLWVHDNVVEPVVHERIEKGMENLTEKAKETLIK